MYFVGLNNKKSVQQIGEITQYLLFRHRISILNKSIFLEINLFNYLYIFFIKRIFAASPNKTKIDTKCLQGERF